MNVSFENPDKVNGQITVTVEEADYKDHVEKTLKNYRKQANVPGFRKGQVPMGIIKRQYGTYAKMDEINKLVGEAIDKYVKDSNLKTIGQPLASEKQEPQDLEKEPPYTFIFDIALEPEFSIELSGKDKIDYYDIKVDDALVDRQVDAFTSQLGSYANAKSYQDGDVLKGDLRELDANGNTKEDGIVAEGKSIMPSYIHVDEQKKRFDGAKLGDIITFNPRKAYPDNDTEVASLLGIDRDKAKDADADFSFQITEISRFKKHEVNQELFDQIYGKDQVKDEKEFRQRIADGLKAQLNQNADVRFLTDLRAYCEKKVGKLAYPDELLKRIMQNANKDKDREFIDKNYDASIKELTWQLIRDRLAEANNVKIEQDDVKASAKEFARAQFAQYGMNNVPEEYVDNYANEMMKKDETVTRLVERSLDRKLAETLKQVVKLNKKEISLDDFNKLGA